MHSSMNNAERVFSRDGVERDVREGKGRKTGSLCRVTCALCSPLYFALCWCGSAIYMVNLGETVKGSAVEIFWHGVELVASPPEEEDFASNTIMNECSFCVRLSLLSGSWSTLGWCAFFSCLVRAPLLLLHSALLCRHVKLLPFALLWFISSCWFISF